MRLLAAANKSLQRAYDVTRVGGIVVRALGGRKTKTEISTNHDSARRFRLQPKRRCDVIDVVGSEAEVVKQSAVVLRIGKIIARALQEWNPN